MNTLFRSGTALLLLFTFFFQFETNAQIHDIKKKSSSNKSKSSSSSSSSSSSDSGNDIASECVGGCLTEIFSSLFEGCLTSIFSGKDDDNDDDNYNYTYNNNSDNGFDDDYLYEEPKTKTNDEEEIISNDSITNKLNPEYTVNENIPTKVNEKKIEITDNPFSENLKSNKDFSFEIKPIFDIGFHKGIDRNYTYVDYLPGARANLNVLLIDFRYNILTEYTDDFPNSIKSWELLFIIDLTANQDYKVLIGTGIDKEIWDDDPISFQEWYLGTKIPFANGKDYFDADTRFSVDYETDVFPFFEIGARYNKQVLDFEHLSAHVTLGVDYQNYYQSHDIWSLRGGIIVKIY